MNYIIFIQNGITVVIFKIQNFIAESKFIIKKLNNTPCDA